VHALYILNIKVTTVRERMWQHSTRALSEGCNTGASFRHHEFFMDCEIQERVNDRIWCSVTATRNSEVSQMNRFGVGIDDTVLKFSLVE
jgi:hypothetical protein